MPIDRDGDGPPLRRPESKVSLTPGTERGTDLRATPFTDDVFNDDYYGRRPARSEGSRSFSVVVGVVLGLVAAAGAGWYFFKGSGVTFTPGSVGFVQADPSPYKIKPDNPGGMQAENQDKLVYDRIAKGNAPNRVENLLPPPEEPKAPPPKPESQTPPPAPPADHPADLAKAGSEDVIGNAIAGKAETAKPVEVAKAPEPEPAAKVEAPKPEAPKPEPVKEAAKEPAKPEVDPLAAAVAAATGGRTSATGPITVGPEAPAETKPEAKTEAKPEPAAETKTAAVTPAPAPTATASGQTFQIQLASVLSEDAANAEWNRLKGKYKDLLGTLTPAVTKADLGDRGVFYRLRAGAFADKTAAEELCKSLADVKVGCIPVKQ